MGMLEDEVIISFHKKIKSIEVIHDLDQQLFTKIPKRIGAYDGHELAFDETHGRLFAYGKNAEELFKVMLPVLKDYDFLEGAEVYLKFYKEDDTYSEIEFTLDLEAI